MDKPSFDCWSSTGDGARLLTPTLLGLPLENWTALLGINLASMY